jgi:hypothetical protein
LKFPLLLCKNKFSRASPSWHDGYSTFYVDSNDKIVRHIADKVKGPFCFFLLVALEAQVNIRMYQCCISASLWCSFVEPWHLVGSGSRSAGP